MNPTPFASFKCNRWPNSPGGRIANSVRIAIVGDSMVYGQGVPYLQTLGPRLARHLNIARPGLWFDCQTFGVPGACTWHALARAESYTAAIEPDILVIGLSQNDACMLRPQPSTVEATGQSWVDFAPQLEEALVTFGERWRAAGRTAHIAVVYFDWIGDFAGKRPADILQPICEKAGLLFVDGVDALAGTPPAASWVSAVDSHLNASAHDKVARQLARALQGLDWLPECSDYDDPRWLNAIEAAGASQVDAGVPPAVAVSEGLQVLRLKWLDRRNRFRDAHQTRFEAIDLRLRVRARHEWSTLALQSFQREFGSVPSIPLQIAELEDYIYRASTLNHVIRYASQTGNLGQPVSGLLSHWSDHPPFTLGDLDSARQRAEARATRAGDMLRAARTCGSQAPELRSLIAMAAQARQTNLAAAAGIAELDRLTRDPLPDSADLQGVLRDALAMWRTADSGLADADERTNWCGIAPMLAGFSPDRASMTLSINVVAAPGPELWDYRVGAFSPIDAVHESYVACGYLVRDGRPTIYPIDLPLMVSSTITFTIKGEGFGSGAPADMLRVLPARLEAPGLPSMQFPLSRATRKSESIVTVEFTPTLLARTA